MPQQNGVSERLKRTIMDKVRSMLSETSLGSEFWAEATSTAVYLINRTLVLALILTFLKKDGQEERLIYHTSGVLVAQYMYT